VTAFPEKEGTRVELLALEFASSPG